MSSQSHTNALIFDMGGVVLEIDFERAFAEWEKHSELTIIEIRKRFKMDAAYERHERGQIDASEYFRHLRETLSLQAQDDEIKRDLLVKSPV